MAAAAHTTSRLRTQPAAHLATMQDALEKEGSLDAALRMLLGIVIAPHSRPLQRPIVTGLKKLAAGSTAAQSRAWDHWAAWSC